MRNRTPSRIWMGVAALFAVAAARTPAVPLGARPDDRPPRASSIAASNAFPDIVISGRDSQEHLPAIAFNSRHDEYLVVWENDWGGGDHDIYGQRVAADGRLQSWFSLAAGRSQLSPAIAYDADRDRYLVVWAYDVMGNAGDLDIYGAFVPWNGPGQGWAPFEICTWRGNQTQPAVTYNPVRGEFLVVWKNSDAGTPTAITARRVLAAGGFPPGDAFTLCSRGENRDAPDVTYNLHRNEYLVTWDIEITATDRDIRGIRLRGDGAPLTGGSAGLVGEFIVADYIGSFEAAAAVAACGDADQYLVAWQSDDGTGGADWEIYARYLNGDAVPGNIHRIESTAELELNVDVDCSLAGNRYVLAWQARRDGATYGIRARLASPREALQPAFWVSEPGPGADRVFPAVSAGRSVALAAWEHLRDGGGNRDIHGALLQHALYLPAMYSGGR
jgi:hypothetical protein